MIKDPEEYQEQNAVLRSLRGGGVGGWGYPEIEPARFDGDVGLTPLAKQISPTPDHKKDGSSRTNLVLPFQIHNHSAQRISARLHHECSGGEWPQTDLHVYQPEMFRGRVHPVYLAGEEGREEWIHLLPGQLIDLNLRMDWPGTGSVFAVKLMDTTVPQDYVVRFVLVFGSGSFGQKYYVLSPKVVVGMALDVSESALK